MLRTGSAATGEWVSDAADQGNGTARSRAVNAKAMALVVAEARQCDDGFAKTDSTVAALHAELLARLEANTSFEFSDDSKPNQPADCLADSGFRIRGCPSHPQHWTDRACGIGSRRCAWVPQHMKQERRCFLHADLVNVPARRLIGVGNSASSPSRRFRPRGPVEGIAAFDRARDVCGDAMRQALNNPRPGSFETP